MSKVLVIRTSSLGDVVMLVPVVYSVATRYPQDRFVVMTRQAYTPLFENLGFNISTLPVDVNKKHKGARGLLRLIKRTTINSFTHVADEHGVLRSKLISSVMKITGRKVVSIDKGRKEKQDLVLNKTIDSPLKSTIQRYRDVFEKLGFPSDMVFNNFFDFAPRNLSSLSYLVGEKRGKWIGLAPFSKHRGKIYPLDKMEKVLERLAHKNNTVFLFGSGKEESEILSGWQQKYENVINISGKLNLEKELLLISYLDVMISMDSANMHLASLVRTPVVSVWGATHPSMGFYGFGQDPENAVQIDLECRPCSVYGEIPCKSGNYTCMNNIREEAIIERVENVLKSK